MFSVLGSRFSVLGSRFSVLGSRFSVLGSLKLLNPFIFASLVTVVSCGGGGGGGGGNSGNNGNGETPKAPFESIWNIQNAGHNIVLPLPAGFTYNFTVDWGDGETDTITSHTDSERTHQYASAGNKTVTIRGTLPAWDFGAIVASSGQIVEVTDLGDVGWMDLSGAFRNCRNLTTFSGGNVSNVTDMSGMFAQTRGLTLDTSGWDTSNVTNMSSMFASSYNINLDASGWDTSNVTNMNSMFAFANSSGINVSGWNTSSVENMQQMFFDSQNVNPDMGNWNFASVTNMTNMLTDASQVSIVNYSNFLIRLEATNSKSNITLGGPSSGYNSTAQGARAALINRGWTINDGGLQ